MSEWASTKRVAGEVIFGVGRTLKGDLHLQMITAVRSSLETPLEMLNRTDGFFPLTLSGGDVCLVSKDQVAAVSCGPDAPEPSLLPMAEPLQIEVHMADGSEYQGDVHIELKPPSNRGLDLLNQPERFFALTMTGRIWYLNRSHVRYVRPHD